MGVNDRRDGVGRVVEAVYEFEAECDQQRKRKKKIGPRAGDGDAVKISCDMKGDVSQATCKGDQEGQDTRPAWRLPHLAFKQGLARRHYINNRCEVGHQKSPRRPEEFRTRLGLQVFDSTVNFFRE